MGGQDKNAIAVLDRAVQDVKMRFKRILARTGKGDEKLKLEQALKAHNNSLHGTVHGAPNEVGKNPEIIFMNLVANARKFEHNAAVLDDRKEKLQEAGAFRRPLEGVIKNPFRRGYDAKYGDAQRVADIQGSTVTGADGKKIDIKLVKV